MQIRAKNKTNYKDKKIDVLIYLWIDRLMSKKQRDKKRQ